jgi:hypothetical protein
VLLQLQQWQFLPSLISHSGLICPSHFCKADYKGEKVMVTHKYLNMLIESICESNSFTHLSRVPWNIQHHTRVSLLSVVNLYIVSFVPARAVLTPSHMESSHLLPLQILRVGCCRSGGPLWRPRPFPRLTLTNGHLPPRTQHFMVPPEENALGCRPGSSLRQST